MGNLFTNFRCSRVSLGKGKDNGVMPKILGLKLDERTGVHTLMLKDGIISGMCVFLSGFQFLGFMASCSPVAHCRTSVALVLKPIAFLQPPRICNSPSLAPLLGVSSLVTYSPPLLCIPFWVGLLCAGGVQYVWAGLLAQLAVERMGLGLSPGAGPVCGGQLKGKEDLKESRGICKMLH